MVDNQAIMYATVIISSVVSLIMLIVASSYKSRIMLYIQTCRQNGVYLMTLVSVLEKRKDLTDAEKELLAFVKTYAKQMLTMVSLEPEANAKTA
jgi:hypothetical protein